MYALEYYCKDCKWQCCDREKVLVCPECSSSNIEVSDGKWVVSDKRGHLVPMIEVFKVLVCPECSSSNIEVIDDTGDEESYPLDTPTEEVLSEL